MNARNAVSQSVSHSLKRRDAVPDSRRFCGLGSQPLKGTARLARISVIHRVIHRVGISVIHRVIHRVGISVVHRVVHRAAYHQNVISVPAVDLIRNRETGPVQ